MFEKLLLLLKDKPDQLLDRIPTSLNLNGTFKKYLCFHFVQLRITSVFTKCLIFRPLFL